MKYTAMRKLQQFKEGDFYDVQEAKDHAAKHQIKEIAKMKLERYRHVKREMKKAKP